MGEYGQIKAINILIDMYGNPCLYDNVIHLGNQTIPNIM